MFSIIFVNSFSLTELFKYGPVFVILW